VQIGPLISAKQRERIPGDIESGVSEGAELLLTGGEHQDRGYVVEPTVQTKATCTA
jgi:acyl-CoA reductase-like NAD-dependent aldehyde dehydrogenase